MPDVIARCGFLGAWLLVAGPLDQAVRELQDQDFEHEAITRAAWGGLVLLMLVVCGMSTKYRRHRRERHAADA